MKKAAKILLIIYAIISLIDVIRYSINLPMITLDYVNSLLESFQIAEVDANTVLIILRGFYIYTIISSVVGICIAIITFMMIQKGKPRKKLILWGVLSILFVGIIPGILVLLIKDDEPVIINQGNTNTSTSSENLDASNQNNSDSDFDYSDVGRL